ncbi:cryptochrome/photolyase family protein [Salisediminibacterium halotolerans]|uniref:Deoxyribodipyrimidine photo-lyase n=1 Tax=Salisediminibacterium halotolerans TaxID=517425 RepID=A0A1H9UHH0_9BACI|nr:deoxyribodipyrimidine photo-lyase [Salisediminibacterium haloalkalitolerans]SES08634.1 deoxyribodipyrimidine photo-lyase [Salisediminibacterium haloalkalitolerans]
MTDTIGVWFRNDLRLTDNPALYRAFNKAEKDGSKLVLFFHLHEHFTAEITARNDYFFQTLAHFRNRLSANQITLHLLHGPVTRAFEQLIAAVPDLSAVYATLSRTPFAAERDEHVFTQLNEPGIDFQLFDGNSIAGTRDVLKSDGTPYKVYTPYMRSWRKTAKRELAASEKIAEKLPGMTVLKPVDPDAEKFFDTTVLPACSRKWPSIGEHDGRQRLQEFIDGKMTAYKQARDMPELDGTSRISMHLATGSLSALYVYRNVLPYADNGDESAQTFLNELAWRDFYAMIYDYFPFLKHQAFKEAFRTIPWDENPQHFKAWSDGLTGFPIVDAAMRQLEQTGWMHNRLRMITASFLTKDLHIDWRKGEQYFERKLIDYDEASNVGGWQWASSVGTDAVPYFRIFNPYRQSERFDPDGVFIRLYVPELADVPDRYIHKPHLMPLDSQHSSGCRIGRDYPEPIVDHDTERKRALARYKGEDSL